jgi:hypothetical protein
MGRAEAGARLTRAADLYPILNFMSRYCNKPVTVAPASQARSGAM